MSQIANTYTVTEEQVHELDQLAAAEDWDSYWKLLQKHKATPEYGYSGYVVVVLTVFLEERGVFLSSKTKKFQQLERDGTSYLTTAEARNVANALLELDTTDEEFEQFFADFTGEPFEDAAVAMWDGIELIRIGCEAAAESDKYFLLSVG